jgi:hypothetical protein
VDDVEAFAEHLVVLGCSSYTVRSYRLGVEHVRRWLTHDRWMMLRGRWSVTISASSRRELIAVSIDALLLERSTIGSPRSRRPMGT